MWLVVNSPGCFIQLVSSLEPDTCEHADLYQVGWSSLNKLIPSSSTRHLISSVHPSQLTPTQIKTKHENMLVSKNQAAWLQKADTLLRVGDAVLPRAGAGRIVCRRHQPARLSHAGRRRLRSAMAHRLWLRRRRRGVRGRLQCGWLQEGRSYHWVSGAAWSVPNIY